MKIVRFQLKDNILSFNWIAKFDSNSTKRNSGFHTEESAEDVKIMAIEAANLGSHFQNSRPSDKPSAHLQADQSRFIEFTVEFWN